jgi:hypothetical protein
VSYCLKTGGVIFDEAHSTAQRCDLHIEGNCVIAYTAGEPDAGDFAGEADIIILRHARPFTRDSKPYGITVVRQVDCLATEQLKAHIQKWYPAYHLEFIK